MEVRVVNTGHKSGADTVLLYLVSPVGVEAGAPQKSLAAFEKVLVARGIVMVIFFGKQTRI